MTNLLHQLVSLSRLQPACTFAIAPEFMVGKAVRANHRRGYMVNINFRFPVLLAVLVCTGILVSQFVQADNLSGSEDPVLQDAIELWLEDNDKDSLPVIATLAAEGNIAARLLLAQIENTERAPGNFVSSMPRKERVKLFRSTSGKGNFRPSWLKSEMLAGNEFAAALLKAPALEVNIEAIKTLYTLGEPESTYDLVRQVAGNGSKQEKQELAEFLPETSELMPYLRALQTPVAGVTPGISALKMIMGGDEINQSEVILQGSEKDTSDAAVFVEYAYQNGVQSVHFDQTNSYYGDLAIWIESAPATASIATLCDRHCDSENTHSCAITAFGLVGGYYKVIRFDSPLESLIKQSRYASSKRASGMLLRRISSVKNAGGNLLISDSGLHEKSECLAKAVADVRAGTN